MFEVEEVTLKWVKDKRVKIEGRLERLENDDNLVLIIDISKIMPYVMGKCAEFFMCGSTIVKCKIIGPFNSRAEPPHFKWERCS